VDGGSIPARCLVVLTEFINVFLEPNFVGSYDIGDYVYFFFRETAVEYINCGKNIYSRVARVCKQDNGGKNILSQNWATFLKARLNCSIPGEFPFYFNEIRTYLPALLLHFRSFVAKLSIVCHQATVKLNYLLN